MAGWNEWVPGTNMTLSEVLDALKSASIGLDVKDKLYWSFFKVVQEAIKEGNANFDVEMAKGRFKDLASRLDAGDEHVDDIIAEVKSQLGDLGATATFKGSATNAVILAKTGIVVGDEWFDTTNQQSLRWNGAAWVAVGGVVKLGEGSVTTQNYASGSVTPSVTSFINASSSNFFNKNDMQNETTISNTTGEMEYNAITTASRPFVKVDSNTVYTFTGMFGVAKYDAGYNFIDRWTETNAIEIVKPHSIDTGNAGYLKFVVRPQELGMAQINKGSTLMAYEEYVEVIKGDLIGNKSLTAEKIKRKSITTNELDFIKPSSSNLFNKLDMRDGITISPEGVESTHATVGSSKNFQEVKPNTLYTATRIFRTILYNSAFKAVGSWQVNESGGQTNQPQTFNTGSGVYAKYLVTKENYDLAQINEGASSVEYDSYRESFVDGIASEINISNNEDIIVASQVEVHKSTGGVLKTIARDYNRLPLTPVWGHEYMWSWYEKIRLNQPLKMVWAGDSTTQGGATSDFLRHNLGKKIMTLGGYDESFITTINAGHGSRHTGNWLGGEYNDGAMTTESYNFLAEDMAGNPDLYVIAYGVNDGSPAHHPTLTWQGRIDRFERNMRIGLERIRGTMYNKSADEMAIILCTPVSTKSASGITPQLWNDRIQSIIQELCREYHCSFVDISARQYDHSFSNSWSLNGDFLHPTETSNADYVSMMANLLYPYLLHK